MKIGKTQLKTERKSEEDLKLKLKEKLAKLMHHPAAPNEFKRKLSESILKLSE